MPRHRAAAIVLQRNALLVMRRQKLNEPAYYVFVGGGIEQNESPEQTAVREVYEESSLRVCVERTLYTVTHDNGDIHYYFLCLYVSGTPAVQMNTNEARDNTLGIDTHQPQWLSAVELTSTTLYPFVIRDQLIHDLEHGFRTDIRMFELEAMR